MASQVLRASFPSRVLQRNWDFVAYLPDGYDRGSAFPIAYLLHGACGAAPDYVEQGNLQATADRLIRRRFIEPAVIVTPGGYDSWYVDSAFMRMQEAFLTEFMPHVEGMLRVRNERASRAIGGLSMGGYGSLRFALLRPDLFHALAVMSPAIYHDVPPPQSSACLDPVFRAPGHPDVFDPVMWQAHLYPTLIEPYLAAGKPLRFHVASGDRDEFGIHDEALRLYHVLRQHDQDALFRLAPGGHDWSTWTPAIDEALRFLLEPGAEA